MELLEELQENQSMNGITLNTQVIDPKIDLLSREVIETQKTIYIPDTSKDNRPDPGQSKPSKLNPY